MAQGVLAVCEREYMSDVEEIGSPQTTWNRKENLRVLLVEDSELDMVLLLRHLQVHGYKTQHQRVASQPEMEAALEQSWDVILCDYQMPQFGVLPALALLRNRGLNL